MDTTFPDTSVNSAPAADPQPVSAPSAPPPPDPEVLGREAAEVLATMLPMLNFRATMKTTLEKDTIRIQLECEEAARLIGRRGSTINELQFLLNRILQRRHKMAPRVFLDVDAPLVLEKEREKDARASTDSKSCPPPSTTDAIRTDASMPTFTSVEELPKPNVSPLLIRVESIASQVRRWGDAMELGAMNDEERDIVRGYFQKDRELEAIVLEGQNGGKGLLKMRIQLRQK